MHLLQNEYECITVVDKNKRKKRNTCVNADTNASKLADAVDGASLPLSSCPHQQQFVAADRFTTIAASSLADNDDAVAFPPPPPAHLLHQQDAAAGDSDDEFPLPPPPVTETTTPQPSQAAYAPPMKPAARHPALMQSLSMRLAERGSVQMRPGPPPVAAKHHRMTTTEQPASHPVATAVAASTDTNLLLQIHRGVSLRRTISNDRSAPKIPGKR